MSDKIESFGDCWNTFKDWNKLDFLKDIVLDPRPEQSYSELEILYGHLEKLRPSNILEIGTRIGGTLRFWINLAADDAKIIVIDKNIIPQLIPIWNSWLRKNQKLFIIDKDSLKDKEFILSNIHTILGESKLDFLHIDGEHITLFTKSDFETYAPLVRKGGIIAFHDIAPFPINQYEIAIYWYELKKALLEISYIDTIEIICRHQISGCSGIGMLILKEEITKDLINRLLI